MNQKERELLDSLMQRAEVRLEKATPGEQAIICMLMVISAQLESMEGTQEKFADQFNCVSRGGNSFLVEVQS